MDCYDEIVATPKVRKRRDRTTTARPPSDTYGRIYRVVSRIPRGRVATYGQVAAVAGLPRQARLVGYALNVLPMNSTVPWHRVVNAQGRISLRSGGLGHDDLQAQMLAQEGVVLEDGSLSLARYQWRPRPKKTPPRPRSAQPLE